MLTLWDLLRQVGDVLAPPPKKKPGRPKAGARKVTPGRKPVRKVAGKRPRTKQPALTTSQNPAAHNGSTAKVAKPGPAPKLSMEERYEQITRQYLAEHGIKVRKWRTAMTGIATEVRYKDGRIGKYIESPRPRGPMSMAVFLHEIGHHVIGFNTYKPRCLEEYHAWRYAIEQMELLELNITDSVRRRMHNSLRYAVQKARRRGIREVPEELRPYLQPWKGAEKGEQQREKMRKSA